jgi:multidrug efflux pump subunit AcrA (membrane-fusion protein)
VTFVDNRIDSGSGTIRIRASLADPQHLLTPGAHARIAIEEAAPRPVLLIHEQAVQAQLATRYVLTVDAAGITAFRPVTLGTAHGALREVTGLAPTDRIVATNLGKVFFPGMPVAAQPVDMETLQPVPAAESAPAAPAAPAVGR